MIQKKGHKTLKKIHKMKMKNNLKVKLNGKQYTIILNKMNKHKKFQRDINQLMMMLFGKFMLIILNQNKILLKKRGKYTKGNINIILKIQNLLKNHQKMEKMMMKRIVIKMSNNNLQREIAKDKNPIIVKVMHQNKTEIK